MNKERYQFILDSHLLPFIDTQCGGRDNCIFWSDLASTHYTTDVQTWLTSENFGSKNVKTTLQTVPTETYWIYMVNA